MDRKLLLVGVISNVSKTIEKELRIVLKSLSSFDDITIFLVESDSNDETVQILKNIQSTTQNFSFVSKGKLSKILPNRIERIAFCRNVYVDFIRNNYKKYLWGYVAVADLDGMNFKINKQGIDSCFKVNKKWDGLMANQPYGYYDIYALRARGWVEYDCFLELSKVKKESTPPKASKYNLLSFFKLFNYYDKLRKKIIFDKMIRLNQNRGLIKVDSAFGGFAIYKVDVFFDSDYQLSDSFSSEHVSFHRSKANLQKSFYINTKLVNNRLNEYNLNKLIVIRFLKELKKFLLSPQR
jgi:hypothetical protein